MLECASPPIYVSVDGHAYGVFEVRSTAQLEAIQAAAAAAPPRLAPAPRAPDVSPFARAAAGAAGRPMTMDEARAAEEEAARAAKRASFIGARKPAAGASGGT